MIKSSTVLLTVYCGLRYVEPQGRVWGKITFYKWLFAQVLAYFFWVSLSPNKEDMKFNDSF